MKNYLIRILLLSLLPLIPYGYLLSQTQPQSIESNIVNGTAEFLTERANDNFFYIYEHKLKKNEFLINFFPKTEGMLGTTQLKILLTNRDIWDNSIKQDLSDIAANFINLINQECKIIPLSEAENIDFILRNISNTKIRIDSATYPLNAEPIISSKKVRAVYESIFSKFQELANDTNNIKIFLSSDIKSLINNKDNISTYIKEKIKSFVDIESIYKSEEYEIIGLNNLQSSISNLKTVLLTIQELYDFLLVVADTNKHNTYRVLNSFKIIEYLANKFPDSTFKSKKIKENFDKYFNEFKLYALFFAQLSEAESKDEVKSILSSYTLPSVSFGTKRDNAKHIFISSYWGLSAGIEAINQNLNFKKQSITGYFGLTAPIGLEHSWGLGENGSISLFASILDFGPVVNSQLFNSGSDIKLKDIISPGIFIIYGIPEIPLAISLGYFHAKSEKLSSLQQHITLNIVFDMPLIIFY